MVSITSALSSINSSPLSLFAPGRVEQLAREHGHAFRDSPLGPAQTVAMFMRQVIAGNVSLTETCRIAGSQVSPQAYCRARQRLPLAVLHGLFGDLQDRLAPETRCDAHLWHGHRVMLVDGSSFSTPDTPELRTHFGAASGQAPGCGFPVAHLLVLFCASTGLLLNVWASPRNTSDVGLTDEAHLLMEEGDVLVGDDSFSGYGHIASLVARGLHGVFPVHHLRKVDFRPGRAHCAGGKGGGKRAVAGRVKSGWIMSLGKRDQVVEYFKPKQCPTRMSREQFEALPESVRVREIRRRVRLPTGRRVTVTVVTTLLDAERYPADEVVGLRLRRWEVETNLAHLKTTMKLDVLRSRSVEGTLKELAVIALIYNLVRVVMLGAARAQGADVRRISFKDAYEWLRHARAGEALPGLRVNPHRPERLEPRCRKRRPKQYDLMNKPRAELRRELRTALSKQTKAA
jgi:hypothetical protein